MKKCKLCKMTALFCAAFLTVCAFLWNMQSVQGDGDTAVSYTHLDVYKRQAFPSWSRTSSTIIRRR